MTKLPEIQTIQHPLYPDKGDELRGVSGEDGYPTSNYGEFVGVRKANDSQAEIVTFNSADMRGEGAAQGWWVRLNKASLLALAAELLAQARELEEPEES